MITPPNFPGEQSRLPWHVMNSEGADHVTITTTTTRVLPFPNAKSHLNITGAEFRGVESTAEAKLKLP